MEQEIITKLVDDVENLKKAVNEIKVVIDVDEELTNEVKQKVFEAEERISNGEFITHEEICKRFGVKCPTI